ncbi:hypothetical protein GOP47_0028123 [Adiantum capillus-veneris]|nr:hypothetical protein GOP47_0028123 [Adiantum capillus-veneris]
MEEASHLARVREEEKKRGGGKGQEGHAKEPQEATPEESKEGQTTPKVAGESSHAPRGKVMKKRKNHPQTAEEANQCDERCKKYSNNNAPCSCTAQPSPPPPPLKKKCHWRLGTCALHEICKYQSTQLIILKAPFSQLVKEIMDEYLDSVTWVEAVALGALQLRVRLLSPQI